MDIIKTSNLFIINCKHADKYSCSVSIPKEVKEYVIWSTYWRLPDSPAELNKIDEDLEIFRNFRLKSYNWIRQWHLFFLQRWSWSISGGSTCSGRNIINLLNDGIKDTEQFSTYSPLYRYQKRSSSILDDKLNSLYRVTINVKNCIRWLKTFTGYSEFHAKAIIRKQAKNTWCHTACQWRCYG